MSTVTIIIKFSESVQLFAGIIHAFRNMRYCFEHVFAGQTVVKILNNMFGTFFFIEHSYFRKQALHTMYITLQKTRKCVHFVENCFFI